MTIIQKRYITVLFLIVISLIFLSSGCAKKTTIVLLPDPAGKVGNVTVYTKAGSIDINEAKENSRSTAKISA